MANEQNLDHFTSEQSREEAVKNGRKGGVASAQARREKKAMKKTLETLLAMPLKNGRSADIDTVKSIAALNGKNITVQEAILLAQIKKAVKGDTKAAEYIRDTSGNKLKEEVALSGGINNPFAGLTTEELKKLIGDD